jgi:hypothetical protein
MQAIHMECRRSDRRVNSQPRDRETGTAILFHLPMRSDQCQVLRADNRRKDEEIKVCLQDQDNTVETIHSHHREEADMDHLGVEEDIHQEGPATVQEAGMEDHRVNRAWEGEVDMLHEAAIPVEEEEGLQWMALPQLVWEWQPAR